MTFIVATNVVASRPPEHRPTGTPHARAKIVKDILYIRVKCWNVGCIVLWDCPCHIFFGIVFVLFRSQTLSSFAPASSTAAFESWDSITITSTLPSVCPENHKKHKLNYVNNGSSACSLGSWTWPQLQGNITTHAVIDPCSKANCFQYLP